MVDYAMWIPRGTLKWLEECKVRAQSIVNPILKWNIYNHLKGCIEKERENIKLLENEPWKEFMSSSG